MNKKLKVDIVLPVYNEEKVLEESVTKLKNFLNNVDFGLRYEWKIIIADNASVDSTLKVATQLSKKHKEVEVFHLPQKGRGRALRNVWLSSKSDIMTYMDIDISTHLSGFPIMVSALENGFDIAFGTRLVHNSRLKRSLLRDVLSKGYNILVRLFLGIHFSDAQCGFKAITRRTAQGLIPLIKDNEWFFDTELLYIAEKLDYRLFEVPVIWVEDTDSRVRIFKTVTDYLKSIARMRFSSSWRKKYYRMKRKDGEK